MPFSPKPPTTSFARLQGLSKQHAIRLGALSFTPHMSGALYCASENMVLVADLHLEQGASLARRGLHVPPFDTAVTLAMLESVLQETSARRLVLLGDSFHDAVAHEEIEPSVAARLKDITQRFDTIWISGNHDPVAPSILGGTCLDELVMGEITLRHIPARLKQGQFEIAGHLHPGATIEQRGTSVRAKCFAADQYRIILPAFGSYTGAVNVRSSAFAHLFEQPTAQVWMIGKTAIHAFPFKRLR
jgi:uncharacterized protein